MHECIFVQYAEHYCDKSVQYAERFCGRPTLFLKNFALQPAKQNSQNSCLTPL